MKGPKKRGHRRARSCYKFNLQEIGIELNNDCPSTQPSETFETFETPNTFEFDDQFRTFKSLAQDSHVSDNDGK